MANNNNAAVTNNNMYYIQGFVSLFLILLVMGGVLYQLFQSHRTRNERIKHKVETEIEKKLYY